MHHTHALHTYFVCTTHKRCIHTLRMHSDMDSRAHAGAGALPCAVWILLLSVQLWWAACMYVCMCMYVFICTYVCMYLWSVWSVCMICMICMYDLYVYMYVYIHTFIHLYIYTFIHTYTYMRRRCVEEHTYIHAYLPTYIHTYIHTRIRDIYMHMTYSHANARVDLCRFTHTSMLYTYSHKTISWNTTHMHAIHADMYHTGMPYMSIHNTNACHTCTYITHMHAIPMAESHVGIRSRSGVISGQCGRQTCVSFKEILIFSYNNDRHVSKARLKILLNFRL